MPLRRFLSRLQRRRARDASGVAAVEFAVIAPVLTVLLAGAFDLGRALDQGIRLETAARAGAQFVLLRPEATQREIECAVLRSIGATCTHDPQNDTIAVSGTPSWATGLRVIFDTTTGGSTDLRCFCTNADGTVSAAVVACNTTCSGNLPLMRTRRVSVEQPYAPLLPFTRFLTRFGACSSDPANPCARRDVVASL